MNNPNANSNIQSEEGKRTFDEAGYYNSEIHELGGRDIDISDDEKSEDKADNQTDYLSPTEEEFPDPSPS